MPTIAKKEEINPDNWTTAQYHCGPQRVLITYGAEPMAFSSPDSEAPSAIQEIYFVTACDEEYRETFQKRFLQLEEACQFINFRYRHFDFEDRGVKDPSGCGSCSAH